MFPFPALLAALLTTTAQEPAAPDDQGVVFAPPDHLYPDYIADPLRSTISLRPTHFTDTGIDGAGNTRWGVSIGQRLGVARVRDWQLDLEVGVLAQFDLDDSNDNIGWDGIYGFQLSHGRAGSLAWRAGVKHDSAHRGDEYIEETGRERINYTREELNAGVALPFADVWEAYTEAGWAYHMGEEDLMEPWRLQAGLQVEPEPAWWGGALGWYAALDVTSYEENDWDPNVALQTGVALFPASSGVWRVGFEFYDGRSPLGEFFQDDEAYIGFGFWIDL